MLGVFGSLLAAQRISKNLLKSCVQQTANMASCKWNRSKGRRAAGQNAWTSELHAGRIAAGPPANSTVQAFRNGVPQPIDVIESVLQWSLVILCILRVLRLGQKDHETGFGFDEQWVTLFPNLPLKAGPQRIILSCDVCNAEV